MKLSQKQHIFVRQYLVTMNGAEAVRRAGYTSRDPAGHAAKLLKGKSVQKAIEEEIAKRNSRLQLDQDYVVRKLYNMVEANISDYLQWNEKTVRLHDSESLSREQLALVKEVAESEGGIRFALHDKLVALDKLARHLGMYEKHRQSRHTQDTRTRDILNQIRAKELSPHDAALMLEAEGLPLPESVRFLLTRAPEPTNDDDGAYSPISPEEMAKRAKERLEAVQIQYEQFVPARQEEVAQLKAAHGDGVDVFRGHEPQDRQE